MENIISNMKRFNWCLGGAAIVLFVAGIWVTAAIADEVPVEEAAAGSRHPMEAGLAFMAAAIAVGIACIGAGLAVSAVGSAAMGAVAERPELMGRSLIYVGLAEGIAIYGLIVSIIILGKV